MTDKHPKEGYLKRRFDTLNQAGIANVRMLMESEEMPQKTIIELWEKQCKIESAIAWIGNLAKTLNPPAEPKILVPPPPANGLKVIN